MDAYDDYRYAEAQLAAIARMETVRDEIVHLDEVLTMSARMAAASGNPDWETRYRRFEPQLDQFIKDALRLDPDASGDGAAVKTDAANAALVAMEHRASTWCGRGKKQEAQRLLSNGEYEAQKKIYAAGMTEFNRTSDADKRLGEQGISGRFCAGMPSQPPPGDVVTTLSVVCISTYTPVVNNHHGKQPEIEPEDSGIRKGI